jgi:transmembrane protein
MWLGAGALGIFTIMATFIAHRFWDLEGPARVAQLNTFLEHATIAAAFILVVVAHIRPRRPVSGPALEIRQHGGQNAS